MSNQCEYEEVDGFRVGLYTFSIANGLQYKSSMMSTNLRANYVTPTRLKEIMLSPETYLDDEHEVFIWLNEQL